MKALVVGLGSIGVRHLNNLRTLGIQDLYALRVRNLPPPAETPTHTLIFKDLEQALNQHPDIVVVANPTHMHVPTTIKALEANAHVYLEKPVSHTFMGVEDLLKMSEQKKRIVIVGCQLRCHPNLMTISQWLSQDRIGRVLSVSADVGEYLPNWHPWEDYRQSYAARSEMGGGVILTLIHELDYLYWLFGEVESVYAAGGKLTPLELDAEDTALITLNTKKGTPIQLRMDYWRNPPVRTLNIVGETGEIFWDYYKGRAILTSNGPHLRESILPDKWDRNDLFLDLMRNFLASIRENRKPSVPLDQSIKVLEIALAAKQSLKEKKVIGLT